MIEPVRRTLEDEMAQLILHKDGAYNIFSTIVDAPIYDSAITLNQLTDVIRHEHGEEGIRGLTGRLNRAHETGCSGYNETLETCILGNRAGENESELSVDDFIAKYLTLVV